MKEVLLFLSLGGAAAFSATPLPAPGHTLGRGLLHGSRSCSGLSMAVDDKTAATLLEAATDEVIAAAAAFGPDKEKFAKVWVSKVTKGELAEPGLMDECLEDDAQERCVRLEEAMKQVNVIMGRWDGLNS